MHEVSDSESPAADDPGAVPAAEVMAILVESQREFLGFLERRLGDRALAQDLLQDAFARSLAKLDALRESDSARAWFYRVLRNAIVDHARRNRTQSERLRRFLSELEAQPEDEETAREVCQCVGRVAHALKPEYRDAVQRVEVEGMSMKDFAASIGITSNNAAVRVFRAREALKRELVRTCGTCAAHGCIDCSCKKGAP
jgi:RNA polymerase sigma-70 factor (ECF subfamily)